MRIMLVTHELTMTGAPIVLLSVAKLFKDSGIDIVFASLTKDEGLSAEAEKAGIKPLVITDAAEFIEEAKKADVVFLNTVVCESALKVLDGRNIPIIWWLHEGDYYFSLLKEKGFSFEELSPAVHVYAVSPVVSRACERYFGRKLPLLPLFTERVDISSVSSGRKFFPDDSTDEKLRLLTVGQYSERKGQDIALEAIKRLKAENREAFDAYCFVFAGDFSSSDQKMVSLVKKAAKDEKNICCLDTLSHEEVLSAMKEADLLFVPSRVETMSAVSVEAEMLKTPVLISDVCGAAADIKDNENGFKFKSEDINNLKNKLLEIAALTKNGADKTPLEKAGEAAGKIYEERYSPEAFAKQILSIVMDAIKSR